MRRFLFNGLFFFGLFFVGISPLSATDESPKQQPEILEFVDHLRQISEIYKVPVAKDVALRVTYTAAKAPSKKVIIYIPGRASFFEKNTHLILTLSGHTTTASHGYAMKNTCDFWCIDPRGQGRSDGRLKSKDTSNKPDQRGHIDSFETYLSDMDHVIQNHILPFYENMDVDIYLMGASLGGHLILRHLQTKGQDLSKKIKGALAIVPMVQMNTDPWPEFVARSLVTVAAKTGFAESYAIGYGDVNLDNPDFTRFKGHHSKKAFEDTNTMMANNLDLVTGGPTYGWVTAAFASQYTLTK